MGRAIKYNQKEFEELLSLKNEYYSRRNYSDYDNVWELGKRIIETNVGKSFDLAFSYFCKKVNYKQMNYHWFLDRFEHIDYYRSVYNFIIDENGNIQHTERYHEWKKKLKPVSFTSGDFQGTWIHKTTNHLMRDFQEIYETNYPERWRNNIIKYYLYVGSHPEYHPIKQYLQYIAYHNDFYHYPIK